MTKIVVSVFRACVYEKCPSFFFSVQLQTELILAPVVQFT